jgi:CRP-like cAMP-binding protein
VEWGLLGSLADAERRDVLAVARRRRFIRGEVVFHEGDPGDTLHLIAKGHVAVRIATPLGDTALLRVLGEGQYFGELAVVAPAPRSATIVCLDVVETLALHRDVLEELRLKHPAVEGVLTQALVAEVRRVSSLLIEALYLPVDCRVWRRVAELAEVYGPAVHGAVLIPLTQDDVAHLAGTTRPSANKVLRSGEERGVLRIGRGRIEVLDVDAVVHLAR